MRRIGVVGAGIVGVQLGRMLQIRGAHVTLFDSNEPGSQTSRKGYNLLIATSTPLIKILSLLSKVLEYYFLSPHLPDLSHSHPTG